VVDTGAFVLLRQPRACPVVCSLKKITSHETAFPSPSRIDKVYCRAPEPMESVT